MSSREERFRKLANGDDHRSPFQRDRDRVLYSPEFRRLSGVTQVVSASEGDFFHNRLTHSLKVAQVGRRIAERLSEEFPELVKAWGGLDPDVVETAGLAHDLGHPPFGHDGEQVICEAVDTQEPADGFEGNAQSFRIVTRLAAHTDNYPDIDDEYDRDVSLGLNLTRATLNAILKYPWIRSESGCRHEKWGVYVTDKDRFNWVKQDQHSDQRLLEAEIMDWADDVTYAVHDLEDFYRIGLIPIHLLGRRSIEQEKFIEAVTQQSPGLASQFKNPEDMLPFALGSMLLLDTPYDRGRRHLSKINAASSTLISEFITGKAIRIGEPSVEQSIVIDRDIRKRVKILKKLTQYYVINHPRIVSVREGQREMLKKLFEIYMNVAERRQRRALLPQETRVRLDRGDKAPRLVADLLAGMTERQVIQNYQRLTGIVPGPMSYFDL